MAKSKGKPKTLYLYPDGHGILVFEDRHPKSGKTNEWVEIIEKVVPHVHVHVRSKRTLEMNDAEKAAADEIEQKDRQGCRLIFSRDVIGLVMKATSIEVWDDSRSTFHKENGYEIRTVTIYMKDGTFSLTEVEHHGQGILSGDGSIQMPSRTRDMSEVTTFAEHAKLREWGWQKLNVAKVERKTPEGSPA